MVVVYRTLWYTRVLSHFVQPCRSIRIAEAQRQRAWQQIARARSGHCQYLAAYSNSIFSIWVKKEIEVSLSGFVEWLEWGSADCSYGAWYDICVRLWAFERGWQVPKIVRKENNEMAESERNLLISSALPRGNRKREELDLRKVARCRYKLFTRARERKEEGRKGKGPNRRHLSLQNAVVKQVTCTRRKIYLSTVHWGICERRQSTSVADCLDRVHLGSASA